ncbi:DUF308 domain-containing protein [Sphingomonas sp. AOB5]|uniref:DUF308 domain-containing protein n=1 Tax=Sphingomonas sp. AOB5 TaxID=3034017 RepID=UPI0023F6C48C|nr:DUF308 domain-containing protein [Sphingomonas sp. AOB5]MDF7774995.1 DUF308 domain-containing protein [Sphingomonas sp. AOB5]
MDDTLPPDASKHWLTRYYLTRGLFSAAWVAAAFTLATGNPVLATVLLIAYPAWDALANLVDAQRSGGLTRNPSQAFNTWISVATTFGVALAIGHSMNLVLAIFGVWAGLSGLLQLATGVRRRKSVGAQWTMILSGAQSMTASVFFIMGSLAPAVPNIRVIAPYAAFGAFYFLLSALLLAISSRKTAQQHA